MGKIEINTSISKDIKEWWHRPVSIKKYFIDLFKDTEKKVAVTIIQNVILFMAALLAVIVIPYVAGNALLPEFIRIIIAALIISLPFLVMVSFERIRILVEGNYHGSSMIISAIILLLMSATLTYTMVNGDIEWANIAICIAALIGSAGLLVHVILKYVRKDNKNEPN